MDQKILTFIESFLDIFILIVCQNGSDWINTDNLWKLEVIVSCFFHRTKKSDLLKQNSLYKQALSLSVFLRCR